MQGLREEMLRAATVINNGAAELPGQPTARLLTGHLGGVPPISALCSPFPVLMAALPAPPVLTSIRADHWIDDQPLSPARRETRIPRQSP